MSTIENIKDTLFFWLSKFTRTPQIVRFAFDSDFVTSNIITVTTDVVLPAFNVSVQFDTDQETTIENLRRKLQDENIIRTAKIVDLRTIDVVVDSLNTENFSCLVTGGATQAVCTITQRQNLSIPTVIFADQNAPRPLNPYIVIRPVSVENIGYDEPRELNCEGIQELVGHRTLSVLISFFASNALELAEKARQSLHFIEVQNLFNTNGFAYWSKSPIQNLTEMLDTDFQPQANFDVTFGYSEEYEEDRGIIEQAPVTEAP